MAWPAASLVACLLVLHLPESEPMTYHIALPGGIQAGPVDLAVLTFYDVTYGVESGLATDEFTLLVSIDNGNDGYLAFPDEHLGTEYYVLTYCETGGTCQFSVIATADRTTLSITFPVGVQTSEVCVNSSGTVIVNPDTSITFTLNEYDVLYFESVQELSGTHIIGSDIISVLAGARDVPDVNGDNTTMSEQLLPVNKWGREFYVVPNENNDMGDLIKIITKTDNTRIEICGYSPFVIVEKGGVAVRRLDWGMPSMVKANKPIMIVQVMSVDLYNNSNSVFVRPSLLLVQAKSQWTNQYLSYCLIPGMHTISIVGSTGNFDSIDVQDPNYTTEINGTLIPGTDKSFFTVNASALTSSWVEITGTTFAAYGLCSNSAAFNLGFNLASTSEDCNETFSSPGDGIDNNCDGRTDEESCVHADLVTTYNTTQNANGSVTYHTEMLNDVDFMTVTVVTCGVLHIKLLQTNTSDTYATIQITQTSAVLELCSPTCVSDTIKNISPIPCTQSREFLIRTKHSLMVVAYDQQDAMIDLADLLFDNIIFTALVDNAQITIDKQRKDCGKIISGDADNLGTRFVVPVSHLEDDFILFVLARNDTEFTIEELPQSKLTTFNVRVNPGTTPVQKSEFITTFSYLVLTAVQDIELSVYMQRTQVDFVTWTELIPADVAGPTYQSFSLRQSDPNMACKVIPTEPRAEVNFFSPDIQPILWGDAGVGTPAGDGMKLIYGSTYRDNNFIHGDKPLAVFCMNTNATVLQMPPHESLGKTHYIPKLGLGFSTGMTSVVRVVTSEHSTTISINGEYDETISIDVKGSTYSRNIASDTLYEIVADKPVLVILEVYKLSCDWSSAVVIPPVNLYKATHHVPKLNGDYNLKPSSAVDSSGMPVTSRLTTLYSESQTLTYPEPTLSITFVEYNPENQVFLLMSDRLYDTINQACEVTNGSLSDGEDNDCDGFIDEDTCQSQIIPGLVDYDIDGSINEDCSLASNGYSAVPDIIFLPANVSTCPTSTTSAPTGAPATMAPSSGTAPVAPVSIVAPSLVAEIENVSLGPVPPPGDVITFLGDTNNETCYTDCLCPCGWTAVQNYTEEEIAALVNEIQLKLRLNKHDLSAQVRKKISAQDDRTSATAIGYAGLAFMLVSIGCVIALDLSVIARHLKMLHDTVKQISGRT